VTGNSRRQFRNELQIVGAFVPGRAAKDAAIAPAEAGVFKPTRAGGARESLRRDLRPGIMRVGRPGRRVVVVGLIAPGGPALALASGE
jgi:hypothetical protein